MISEQLTVTSEPTTIAALLNTARGVTVSATKIVGIMLRYAIASSVTVSLSDEGSVSPAVILDATAEQLYSASFRQFSTEKVLLSSSGADVTVHLIAEQTLTHGH